MDMVEWLLNSGWPSVTLRNRHTKLARLATELRKQRESFSAFLTKKEQDALGDTVRLLTRLKRELTMAAEKKRQLEEEQRTEWERRDREKAEAAARTLFVGMNSQEVVSTCENLNVYLDEVGGVTWTLSREIRRYFDYPTAEHLTRLQYCAGRAVLNELQRSWSRNISLEDFRRFSAERARQRAEDRRLADMCAQNTKIVLLHPQGNKRNV